MKSICGYGKKTVHWLLERFTLMITLLLTPISYILARP